MSSGHGEEHGHAAPAHPAPAAPAKAEPRVMTSRTPIGGSFREALQTFPKGIACGTLGVKFGKRSARSHWEKPGADSPSAHHLLVSLLAEKVKSSWGLQGKLGLDVPLHKDVSHFAEKLRHNLGLGNNASKHWQRVIAMMHELHEKLPARGAKAAVAASAAGHAAAHEPAAHTQPDAHAAHADAHAAEEPAEEAHDAHGAAHEEGHAADDAHAPHDPHPADHDDERHAPPHH